MSKMLFCNIAGCLHKQQHNYNERCLKLLLCDIMRILMIFDKELRKEETYDGSGIKAPSAL